MAGLGFAENQGARVFHIMMIIPAGVLLLLLSLISLGTLGTTNKRFSDEYEKVFDKSGRCILYASSDGEGEIIDFSDGEQCKFGIAGNVILAILAVAFAVVLVVKAVFGIRVVHLLSVIELGLAGFGSLWALIMAAFIHAGLNQTCKAFTKSTPSIEDFPCCSYFFPAQKEEDRVYFYEGINASRITDWFAMAVLICLTGFYACILLLFCFTSRSGTTTVTTTVASKDFSGDTKAI